MNAIEHKECFGMIFPKRGRDMGFRISKLHRKQKAYTTYFSNEPSLSIT